MPSISIPAGVAMLGSAVIGGGVQAYSAGQAANAEKSAAANATRVQEQMYNTTRNDLSPYRDFGASITPELQNLLTGDPSQIEAQLQQLPGYQFTRNQGLQAVQSGAAARGLGTSGAALRGAADYATGLADSTYGNQVNRLMQGAGLGESAAAQTGVFGTQTGQSIGSNILGAGNATAAADIAGGNAIGGAANSISQYYLLNALMKGGGGGLFGASGGGGGGGYTPGNYGIPTDWTG